MAKQCRSSILIEDSLGLFECRCTLERRHEGNVHSDGKLSWLSEPVSSAAQFLKVLQTEIVLLEQLVGDVQAKRPPPAGPSFSVVDLQTNALRLLA